MRHLLTKWIRVAVVAGGLASGVALLSMGEAGATTLPSSSSHSSYSLADQNSNDGRSSAASWDVNWNGDGSWGDNSGWNDPRSGDGGWGDNSGWNDPRSGDGGWGNSSGWNDPRSGDGSWVDNSDCNNA